MTASFLHVTSAGGSQAEFSLGAYATLLVCHEVAHLFAYTVHMESLRKKSWKYVPTPTHPGKLILSFREDHCAERRQKQFSQNCLSSSVAIPHKV